MYSAVASPYLVPFDGRFRVAEAATAPPPEAGDEKSLRKRLDQLTEELDELQRRLYAQSSWALLLVFQALDAAGKDSTIRAVMARVDPAGCRVTSFKRPSSEELGHDFLWRSACRLPERGMIGIFNRSYYEEVLAVRVHPEFLQAQRLPDALGKDHELWAGRYQSIRDHERHMARSGTVVLKLWLNVSRGEQRRRFLARLEEPRKNWKFSPDDVAERGYWQEYMKAYETALAETSRPWAPWYAIPADHKPFLRLAVAETVVATLKSLGLRYPKTPEELQPTFAAMRAILLAEKD